MKKEMYYECPTPEKVKVDVINELKRIRENTQKILVHPNKKSVKKKTVSFKRLKNESSKTIKNQQNTTQRFLLKYRTRLQTKKNQISSPSIKKLLPDLEEGKTKEEEPKKNELNDLPYTTAIKLDQRNILQIFYSFIIQKLDLINLFCGNNKIKVMLICEYILSLLINFFFNTI